MSEMIQTILLVLLALLIIIFGPLVTIWSLNTLFPILSIPYNVATWFATLWLFAFTIYNTKGKA